MNTRLEQFIRAENLSQASFADSINVARASISHILAGRNKPGYDFICNLMNRYPRLNIEWLLTGKGKMYKDASIPTPEPVQTPVATEPQVAKHRNQQIDDSPSVFDVLEDGISDAVNETDENIKIPFNTITLDKQAQQSVKQRKAVKIIIFYDDDSFQEFR
ncbi:MAG: helix-turn-helix domain-containing protein [Candidatus Cryptobacteroides sp.]